MKYLVFNAVVFLALGYLITGGDMKNFTDKISSAEQVTPQAEKIKISKPITPVFEEHPKAEPEKKVEVAGVKSIKEKEVVRPKPIAPPALPKAVEVPKREPQMIPSRKDDVQVAKAEPIEATMVKEVEVNTEPAASQLDQARERSQNLRKMVAEMEQMFAQKMTQ